MKTTRTLLLISIGLLALLLFRTFQEPENIENELDFNPITFYEKSGHSIDLTKTKQLYDNYNKKLKPEIEAKQKILIARENDQFDGTEYVLVSMQELEYYMKFLKEIEKTNEDKTDNEVTGVAIFLGAHNENHTINDTPKFSHNIKSEDELNAPNDRKGVDVRGRITLFLAPTYLDKNLNADNGFNRHQPFYIVPDSPDNKYKGTYTNLYDYLNKDSINKNALRSSSNGSGGTSLNSEEFNSAPPPKG